MNAYSGIVHDLDERAYHAHQALSSTGARQILDSPARFNYLRSQPSVQKDAFDLGTAVHTKVLGVGPRVTTYPHEHLTPAGAVSTKAATVAWAEEQRANGFTVISAAQAAAVDGMAEAVLAHPTARLLFEQPGAPEASVFATDRETGVDMRARFDFLPDLDNSNPIAVDLKTSSRPASKDGFERSVVDYGYETQQEWYLHALGEQIPFVFVVAETAAPHLVAVHQLDVVFREMGQTKGRRAREIFAQCSQSGTWPGYPDDVQLLSPPTWAVFRHAEKYDA